MLFLSSIIHKSQNVETFQVLLIDEWKNKMWYIPAVEYYSVIKKNDISIYVTTWMDLENMLSEKLDTERQIIYDFSYLRYLEWANS